MAENRKILIGKILTTHNLNGNVKLLSYAEIPDEIFNYSLYSADGKEMKCKKVGLTSRGDTFLAKFEGIDSVEKAREYRNFDLFVKRKDLEKTKNGEIYVDDLMGMKVKGDGNSGIVEDFYNYGGGDAMDVRWDDGKLESIPFNDDYIREIKNNIVYINRPKYI